MEILKTIGLFVITAFAEIIGCYMPYLWIKQGKSIFLLIPGLLSLIIFAWLLTLHPVASGRIYAAYGGIYITVAIFWLWMVDKIKPSIFDIIGILVILIGVTIMIIGYRK